MKFISIIVLMFIPFLVMAEGGKNQKQNPIFEDGCVTAIPAGMEDCSQVLLKPEQSGINVFNCEVIVTCPDDTEED